MDAIMKVKKTSAAGTFYPQDKEELKKLIKSFASEKICDMSSRAVIVPHAGYSYSGELTYKGLNYLDKSVKNIFIIAPSHKVVISDVTLSSYSAFETPLGNIEVNQDIIEELKEKFSCVVNDKAFEDEHSIENLLPIIQSMYKDVKIVPIIGSIPQKIAKIIENYFEDKSNAFVISSDLSHFHHAIEAQKIDKITAEMIESNTGDRLSPPQACGVCGIQALSIFAKENDYSLFRLGLYNSSQTTKDLTNVVGYGSWVLYDGTRNAFIKKHFSNIVLDICKQSIKAGLDGKDYKPQNLPAIFEQLGASFVTIEEETKLRGCIGTVVAHRALVDDLVHNAYNAGFSDPRFAPLTKDDISKIKINISLLSEPEKMNFKDEADLINQLQPMKDGLIIKDEGLQGVYLPTVWEQITEKEMFLKSLKIKAGMPPTHFSSHFEAFRFKTEYIEE